MKIFFLVLILFISCFLKADFLKCEGADSAVVSGSTLENFKKISSTTMALGLISGNKIKTLADQKITLHFFKPTEHKIAILENSIVEITSPMSSGCEGSLLILKGHIISEGEHGSVQKNKKCPDQVEIQTLNVDIIPRGTKYSVDLNSAIAEANGDPVETENYSVEKGSIQIKLKKIKPNSNSKSQRIAKNGLLNLKAGQKAKIKINQKTKFADIEVIEP